MITGRQGLLFLVYISSIGNEKKYREVGAKTKRRYGFMKTSSLERKHHDKQDTPGVSPRDDGQHTTVYYGAARYLAMMNFNQMGAFLRYYGGGILNSTTT